MAKFDRTFYWSAIVSIAHFVQFSSYLTLNNSLTLKSGIHCRLLKIIENGTIRKLGYGFLFAFHSNYMILSCIISEIKRDVGRKSQFFHTPCIRRPR